MISGEFVTQAHLHIRCGIMDRKKEQGIGVANRQPGPISARGKGFWGSAGWQCSIFLKRLLFWARKSYFLTSKMQIIIIFF